MSTAMVLIAWLLLTMLSLKPIFAEEDSEIMGRPTRPKVFTNVDDLKEYLELVKDYYALKGKARYGKRAENSQNVFDPPDYSRESFRLQLKILEQVFQGVQQSGQQIRNQRQHLARDNYPEDNNKLSKPVQFDGVKLSRIYSILTKSDDRPQ